MFVYSSIIITASALAGFAIAQTPGKTPENHPKLTTYKCTKSGGCKELHSAVVLDAATHNIHQKNDVSRGCGNFGIGADPSVCPDEKTCAANCIIEGIDKYEDYGVKVWGGKMLQLDMLNKDGSVVGPRVYLLNQDGNNYEMLKLLGNEISFDVDASRLPCGMNGALYLSEMEASGGRRDLNPGGASYGTGEFMQVI
ncbi:hypothetical protein NX059_003064 [Plenodomus lindquistii]|nr:hypothetical protein NX059_003064 [Plenodomus lindquistii]